MWFKFAVLYSLRCYCKLHLQGKSWPPEKNHRCGKSYLKWQRPYSRSVDFGRSSRWCGGEWVERSNYPFLFCHILYERAHPIKKPSTKVSLKYSGLDLKRYIYFLFTTAPLYDLISNLTHPVGASGSRSCRFHHFTPLASVKWLTPALTDAPVLLWLRHARKSVGLYKKTWKKREGCTVA